MKLDHLLTSHIRINSKWIKDFNVIPETIKILEENISSKISDIAQSNILLDISPQAREAKEKINRLDYIKLKVVIQQRKTSIKFLKPTEWENIFANTSDKMLIP